MSDSRLVRLHVFVDHSSVEVFINEGETVLTALVFPQVPYQSVLLSADAGIEVTAGAVHELTSIWPRD
jgi:sucrose-6-phosphate hydrolase SacC (GH32 family)